MNLWAIQNGCAVGRIPVGIYADPGSLPTDARNTLRDPCYTSYFNVKVDGYEGGGFALLAPF